MHIDNNLTFDIHVSRICRKAGYQLNALKRTKMSFKPDQCFTVFNSFIMSNFNFCPLVWHFCGIPTVAKMEKVQERALRCIYNDENSSYVTLLAKANTNSLFISRIQKFAVEVYKIMNDICPEYMEELVKLKPSPYAL